MHHEDLAPTPSPRGVGQTDSSTALPTRRLLRAQQEAQRTAGRRASRRPSKPRASAMAAMTFVVGIAVTTTMPAFAVEGASDPEVVRDTTSAVAAARPQSFVAAGAVQHTVTRDAFAAEAKPEVLVPTESLDAITAGAGESTAAADGASGSWMIPVSGRISSSYGPRPDAPVSGVNLSHKGTDLAASCGTPIVAASGGVVEESTYFGTYGNWILIDNGGGIETGYAHNSELLVDVGDTVAAGDVIALLGSTGASSGCHLHFETRVDGEAVDAVPFMSALGVPLG
ncbi:M23 family metallopeptidase [Rathayibacter sp. SD072]|uniref:M23 family metallopeptidase n=1 Tax=Rathayibacter sp. SD072 TaxID=2781731 RepID=UPI001A9689C7|nr:M23 family metallopeptidase [Rathayibacter sp. SD072]MBO0985444.1 M23 family metallopeptidase [Rathayibacter sp. SD072]